MPADIKYNAKSPQFSGKRLTYYEELNTASETKLTAAERRLKYNAVDITDLIGIMLLFHQHSNTTVDDPLTTDFGVPVYKAVHKGIIVGYSSYTLRNNEPELECRVRQGWPPECITATLLSLSRDVNNSSSSSSTRMYNDVSVLKEAIQQMIEWLNRCR